MKMQSVILLGFDRVGQDFIDIFEKLGKKYLVVDYNSTWVCTSRPQGAKNNQPLERLLVQV